MTQERINFIEQQLEKWAREMQAKDYDPRLEGCLPLMIKSYQAEYKERTGNEYLA